MSGRRPEPQDSRDGFPRVAMIDRSVPPAVLLPRDLAAVLDLASERAAREFVTKHGVPHCRLGGRVYVRFSALLGFLEEREERPATEDEIKARAAADLGRIAPTARDRGSRQRPPRRRRGNT